ncbi:hypothetical protein E1301_Tti023986 [Triplophysa tibetana]|uniref:Uncharacterized protein n=1 Tax=Triplophysa tibetana TaxID=1572043 RepID=A0A5A9MYY7_9TELE|nr:hypothetical protein E1301_Tti023986 [Triplophysa tibetana]
MAHSCRWRFPARPGGSSSSGTGRKAGRIRVSASLLNSAGTNSNTNGLGPGFDAALQVSAAIADNLQKFRDVLGDSSGSSSEEKHRRLKEHRRGNQRVKSEPSSPWDSTGRELDTGRPIHGFILLL